ncbi:bacitracin resistance undecaprenyl-diphosphatase BcrC [Bacillus haynesii]|uniref:Bacitracin resistance undecaprenyl-diphosphatase BcrC n=1 Tax=Bacillus haynesii TaxID=1925021 RepID=A0AA90F4A7_9BACI|nr:bacitracin resistance undecaprenyl-diphosphatase BcrC [Bacillus haynesii]MCY7754599.1 bacitracin resistance undecaprenyl-diphosphatase BcrC [Bacillus haynesii]MCY7769720.1 bacitracin resistance undecaprenyl-diphosphatase BcrC [Bacillus haynesii]MCY7793304.1 bacitracin resistance undecaprenyl-diphosphatase BcrC [Bacillus haynesii]MCY7850324.1 bacitracin resistance undecaprenyl-diphosphatase BcrC [Bacillus haynesii]MCY7859956.1 bacitracin resistance undecaprenyl-diphosphatase BcrC [Bacillus h
MSFSELNIDAFRFINDLGKEYSMLNPVVYFMAEYMMYFLALGLVVYWLTRTTKNRLMVIYAVIAFVVAEILGKIMGSLHSNYQPFATLPNVNKLIEHEIDNSFPSDHTILFFSIGFLIFLFHKKTGWLWLVLAFAVGISRIWSGVHYPLDVAAGALLGVLSALFVFWTAPKLSFIHQMLTLYEKVEQRIIPSKSKSNDKSKNF